MGGNRGTYRLRNDRPFSDRHSRDSERNSPGPNCVALHYPVRELLKDYAPRAQLSRSAEQIRAVPAATYTILHAACAATLFRLRRLLQ